MLIRLDGLSIAMWTKRTILHWKYVKEVVSCRQWSYSPVKSTGSGVSMSLYVKTHIKS